jgi:hypothetical protein
MNLCRSGARRTHSPESAAASSRTERADEQNRCSRTLPQVRASWAGTITVSDRV